MGQLSLVTIALGKVRQGIVTSLRAAYRVRISGNRNTKQQLQWWCLPVLQLLGCRGWRIGFYAWFTYVVSSEVSLNYVTGSQEGVM